MEAWYTIYTKPNAEPQVARALMDRGFTIFLPMLPPRPDGRSKPLFPAYLFFRCDLSALVIDEIQWLPGLRWILTFAGKPAVVPDEAIDLIRNGLREIEDAGGLPVHHFKPGDAVVIDGGPLAGLRGVFQGPLGPAERVRILVNFLGVTNRAEVPVDLLRKASDEEVGHGRRRGTRGRGRRINYRPPQG
jgi:transcriptional antiterminator RfaH